MGVAFHVRIYFINHVKTTEPQMLKILSLFLLVSFFVVENVFAQRNAPAGSTLTGSVSVNNTFTTPPMNVCGTQTNNVSECETLAQTLIQNWKYNNTKISNNCGTGLVPDPSTYTYLSGSCTVYSTPCSSGTTPLNQSQQVQWQIRISYKCKVQ